MTIKQTLKRIFLGLLIMIGIISALVSIEIIGGQPMGLFAGSRPADLGFNNSKFKPVSRRPNNVSSQADKSDPLHYIEPISFSGDSASAWKKIVNIVKAEPRVTVVNNSENYLYAEFKSALMGYIDDVEFALDAKASVIHARSASRLGEKDFSVNRKRIETIRAAFNK